MRFERLVDQRVRADIDALVDSRTRAPLHHEMFREAWSQRLRSPRSALVIGIAIASAMVDTLPPVIEHLKSQFPQPTGSVKEIDSAEAVPSLEHGDIDLAFARLEGEQGRRSVRRRSGRIVWRWRCRKCIVSLRYPACSSHRSPARRSLCCFAAFQPELLRQHHSDVPLLQLFAACAARSPVGDVADRFRGMRATHRARARFAEEDGSGVCRGLALRGEVTVMTTAVVWSTERANPIVGAAVEALSKNRVVQAGKPMVARKVRNRAVRGT
jgi:hypothetical protein